MFAIVKTAGSDVGKVASDLLEALRPFAEFEGEDVFWADDAPDDYVWLIHDGLMLTVGMIRAARAAVAKAETL